MTPDEIAAKIPGLSAEQLAAVHAELMGEFWRGFHLANPDSPPVENLKGLVPTVVYFKTRADARVFATVVRSAFELPVEIKLP